MFNRKQRQFCIEHSNKIPKELWINTNEEFTRQRNQPFFLERLKIDKSYDKMNFDHAFLTLFQSQEKN